MSLSLYFIDPPQFSPTTTTRTPTEGEQLTLSFSIDANPPATNDNITLTKNGTLVTDTRFTVNATSLTIADVTHNDSGVYQITASNVAGSGTFTLTVDVYCECKYGNTNIAFTHCYIAIQSQVHTACELVTHSSTAIDQDILAK